MIEALWPAALLDGRLGYAIAAAVVASLMRGFAGFGSAMLLSPVYAILYGPSDMVALVTLLEFGVGFQLVPAATRHVDWPFVGVLSGAAIAGMPLGAVLLTRVDPAILTRTIAFIVLAFVLFMMTGWRYRGRRRHSITAALGLVSGTMMATTSIGGPPVLAYMLSGTDPAVRNRANIILYYGITQIGLISVLLWNGLVAAWHVGFALALMPLYMLGAWLGTRRFHAASDATYRNVALGFLLVVAIYAIAR